MYFFNILYIVADSLLSYMCPICISVLEPDIFVAMYLSHVLVMLVVASSEGMFSLLRGRSCLKCFFKAAPRGYPVTQIFLVFMHSRNASQGERAFHESRMEVISHIHADICKPLQKFLRVSGFYSIQPFICHPVLQIFSYFCSRSLSVS